MTDNDEVLIDPEIPKDPVTDSILNSVKKMLGIFPEVTDFDEDITMNLNSAIATLTQLGVGPTNGFFIEDDEITYEDFIGGNIPILHSVKMYLYFRTRLGFDPPSSSYVLSSMEKQVSELEWRLKTMSELSKDAEIEKVVKNQNGN